MNSEKKSKTGIDILGNIAILKFDKSTKLKDKKKLALEFLKNHKNVKTILEKTDKFSGRLRTQKTKLLAGQNTKEAIYKENGCEFRFNADTCYFSPRLSSERKELAELIKKKEKVLVMFGGIAVYAIVIAKSRKIKVTTIELSRECNKYAKINIKRNKVDELVEIIQGNVRKKSDPEQLGKFDRIIMARPNLKDSFLDTAFKIINKKGTIHYYGFYNESEKEKLKILINEEAKKAKKKIKILKIKKAGDIGPYKFRYRVDFKVLN